MRRTIRFELSWAVLLLATLTAGCAGTAEGTAADSQAALATEVTLFGSTTPATPTDPDTGSVELGVKFEARQPGQVTGIRFYKSPTNTGRHTGHLWSATGKSLASVTFSKETSSGWQVARFSSPVTIRANTQYVVSYHAPAGHYAGDTGFFATSGFSHGPLYALRNGESGGNGVYAYGTSPAFPTQTYQSTNYYVDVLFVPQGGSTAPDAGTDSDAGTVADAGTGADAGVATDGGSGPGTGGGTDGGLPPGVTLQAVEGGPSYYGRWSNSFPGSSDFFPLSVFDQPLGYDATSGTYDASQITAYKNVGINGFMNLYNGYNCALIDSIRAQGMWVIGGPLAQGYEGNTLTGYVWTDEPDGNDRCADVPGAAILGETVPCTATSDGRTPTSVMQQVTDDLHGAKGKGDPTRPVLVQYTKPVALGEGLTDATAAAYVNAGDIVSFDYYPVTDGWENSHDLWLQYDAVQHVRSLANDSRPVWAFIETPEPWTSASWSGITATPAMIVAETWNAIIGGASGIEYFDHDFCGGCGGYALSASTLIDSDPSFAGVQKAVTALNQRITGLAPVLNSPFANGYVTATGAMNVMAKYVAGEGNFYVFAAPRSNAAQTVTFTVAGGYTGPVTVRDEGRTLQATNGAFVDTFADQTAVHIYVVPSH